jgi:hypothetical protein
MSLRMDFESPLRNRYMTSVLPIVYLALLHNSSNFEIYSSISRGRARYRQETRCLQEMRAGAELDQLVEAAVVRL